MASIIIHERGFKAQSRNVWVGELGEGVDSQVGMNG